MDSITIPRAEDYEAWLRHHGYADHYQVASEAGIATTWGWLMDAAHPLTGFVAETGTGLAGLAHIRPCRAAAWAEIGFLDDVVDPASRGQRIGAGCLKCCGIMANQGLADDPLDHPR